MRKRTFATGGPVLPEENYFVKRERELKDFLQKVEQGKYIVILAPRQTGKTTFFYQALKVLAKNPEYIPISLDFEIYSGAEPERFYQIIGRKIIQRIEERLNTLNIPNREAVSGWLNTQGMDDHFSFGQFFEDLNFKLPNRKIFLIIDEFDGIPQDALRDFLYTLRQIYHEKRLNPKHNYIHSVGIVGVKSIAQLDFDHTISPFNIQEQFSLSNFTIEQVAGLYGQYTDEVGQIFTSEVIESVYQKTAGQPFLINRLAQILTEELSIPKEKKIKIEYFRNAYAQILNEDNTHFQHVRRNIRRKEEFKIILNRILFDEREVYFNINDSYISELATYGLVKEENELCVIDNPIYQEIIIRTFTPFINGVEDEYLPGYAVDFMDYLSTGGEIQMDDLLDNFRDFIGRAGYKILDEGQTEGFPFQNPFLQGRKIFVVPEIPKEFVGQYLLLAYLDLFVRKIGGHLYPEVPTGRGRMDIILLYRDEKHIIETKLWRGEKRYQAGKQQLSEYLKKENVPKGYYIVFDHRQDSQPRYERELLDEKTIVSYCIPILT